MKVKYTEFRDFFHTNNLSLPHKHTHSHTLSHTYAHTLSHTHTPPTPQTHSLTHSHTHTHSLSLPHTHPGANPHFSTIAYRCEGHGAQDRVLPASLSFTHAITGTENYNSRIYHFICFSLF